MSNSRCINEQISLPGYLLIRLSGYLHGEVYTSLSVVLNYKEIGYTDSFSLENEFVRESVL